MTIEQFGQTIKQKYPQYQDMTDADLGNKMLSKYPQYQDMVQQPQQPGFLQSVVQGITQPVIRAAKTLTSPIEVAARTAGGMAGGLPFGQAASSAIKQTQAPQDLGYLGKVGTITTPGQLVGTGLELASNLPFGGGVTSVGKGLLKGAVGQALKTGAKAGAKAGALYGAGSAVQEGQKPLDTLLSATVSGGLGAVTGGAIGAIPGATGAAVKTLANPAKTVGSALMSTGTKILTSVIKASSKLSREGFNPANLAKYNIGGSLSEMFDQTSKALSERWNQASAMMKGSPIKINLTDAYQQVVQKLQQSKATQFGQNVKIQNALDDLSKEIDHLVGKDTNVDVPTAHLVKQGAATRGAWEYGKPADEKAAETVYNEFFYALKGMIEKASPAGLKEINKQMSELIPIRNAIIQRIPVTARNQSLSLTDTIAIAAALSNPKSAGLYIAEQLLKSGKFGGALLKAGAKMTGYEGAPKVPFTTDVGQKLLPPPTGTIVKPPIDLPGKGILESQSNIRQSAVPPTTPSTANSITPPALPSKSVSSFQQNLQQAKAETSAHSIDRQGLKDAILRDPYYKKEGSIKDTLGETVVMSKKTATGDKYVLPSSRDDKIKYIGQGYNVVDYVDSIAEREGYKNGVAYLEDVLKYKTPYQSAVESTRQEKDLLKEELSRELKKQESSLSKPPTTQDTGNNVGTKVDIPDWAILPPAFGLSSIKPKNGVGTVYDPTDAKQTRPDGKAVGALGREVKWGDVAIGNRSELSKVKIAYSKGRDVFIHIDALKDVSTPYGKGIFRVNDTMNKRFDGQNRVDIALPKGTKDYSNLFNKLRKIKISYKYL